MSSGYGYNAMIACSNLPSEMHKLKPLLDKRRMKRPFSSKIKTAGGLRSSQNRLAEVLSTQATNDQ